MSLKHMRTLIALVVGLLAVGCGKNKPKVDPTKHERFLWEFEMGDWVESSPAIGSDGTVYVGSEDYKLSMPSRPTPKA